MNKRIVLVSIIVIVFGVLMGLFYMGESKEQLRSAQCKTVYDGLVEYEKPVSIDRFVKRSDLIIEGEVLENGKKGNIKLNSEPASGEETVEKKMKDAGAEDPLAVPCIKYRIKVKDKIYGNSDDEIVLKVTGIGMGSAPELIKGDHVILLLNKDGNTNEYYAASTFAGFYFITSKNKIDPVLKNDEFLQFVSMDMKDFKKKVKELKAKN